MFNHDVSLPMFIEIIVESIIETCYYEKEAHGIELTNINKET